MILLLTALITPIVAFAAPANAAGPHLKESSGSFRVGAPDLSVFAPVVETVGGRLVHLIDLQQDQVKIEFNEAPGLCVAASDSGARAVIHNCDGQLGTIWIEQHSNGHLLFLSNEFMARQLYLCGRDDGTQFLMENLDHGFFCRFDQD